MKFSEKVIKFQEGGPMPAEDPAAAQPEVPATEQGGAPAGGEEQLQPHPCRLRRRAISILQVRRKC